MSVLNALRDLLGQGKPAPGKPAPAPQLRPKPAVQQRPNFRFQATPGSDPSGATGFGIQQPYAPAPLSQAQTNTIPVGQSSASLRQAQAPQRPVDAPSLPANQFRTPAIAQPQLLKPKKLPTARLI